jgi:hypothetical protein
MKYRGIKQKPEEIVEISTCIYHSPSGRYPEILRVNIPKESQWGCIYGRATEIFPGSLDVVSNIL